MQQLWPPRRPDKPSCQLLALKAELAAARANENALRAALMTKSRQREEPRGTSSEGNELEGTAKITGVKRYRELSSRNRPVEVPHNHQLRNDIRDARFALAQQMQNDMRSQSDMRELQDYLFTSRRQANADRTRQQAFLKMFLKL